MIKKLIRVVMLTSLVTSSLSTSLSCGSRQLDRSAAAERIRRADAFTHPYVMIIRHVSDRRHLDPGSPDETREQGEARAVESWRVSTPYRAVIVTLGLVDVHARYAGVEDGRPAYDIDVRLTPQGEALWRQMGSAVDSTAVPLARRKLVAVTGLTTTNTSHATAEFTWQWDMTAAGAAMTGGTPEFNRLPNDVKKMFDTGEPFFPSLRVRSPLTLMGVRRGVANFALYDDGWRIDSIEPSGTAPLNVLD